MSADEPQLVEATIADTVVVNYFLAVGKFHLLANLLGGTVQVPRVVFDPDDSLGAAEEVQSELRRGLLHHERRAADVGLQPRVRRRSMMVLTFFRQLDELASEGLLVPVDLSRPELESYSRFRDADLAQGWGLLVPLGRGEAASVSISLHRSWRLATDDQAAIKVANQLSPATRPLRIRSLLALAIEMRLVSRDEARAIHKDMVDFGFWDSGSV